MSYYEFKYLFVKNYVFRKVVIAIPNSGKFLSWHCHITRTFQPIFSSSFTLSMSRALFRSNFGNQKFLFDSGGVPFLQLCICQKHPCTKITFFLPGKTKSGVPERFLPCNLYRYPSEKTSFLTIISGEVFLPRIRLIISLRFSLVTLSIEP